MASSTSCRESRTHAGELDSRTPSPRCKRRRDNVSPDKSVSSWTLASIRILQKDVNGLLAVFPDLSSRIAKLEHVCEPGPLLQLPAFTPSTNPSLSKDAKFHDIANQVRKLEQTCKDFSETSMALNKIAERLTSVEHLAAHFDERLKSFETTASAQHAQLGADVDPAGWDERLNSESDKVEVLHRLDVIQEQTCASLISLDLQLSTLKASIDNKYDASGDVSCIFQKLGVLESKVACSSNTMGIPDEQNRGFMHDESSHRLKLLDDQVTRIFDIIDSLDRGLTALGEDFERMKTSHSRSKF